MSIFSGILANKPGRNKFNLSHERKLSGQMGQLLPILNAEVLPGDKWQVSSEIMMRFAPMLAPIMHRVNVYTHFFFVPNRLLWDDWEDFITGGPDGLEVPSFPKMQITSANYNTDWIKGSVADYFGLPIDFATWSGPNFQISALPFRAYYEIYKEYYRDQNLEDVDSRITTTGANLGLDEISALLEIRQRAWEKDYFTSALPWAQRGADVLLPTDINYSPNAQIRDTTGAVRGEVQPLGEDGLGNAVSGLDTQQQGIQIQNLESLGITVEDLRRSTRLQEWLERSARGGARYVEQILSHFGVKSSDARLQRPEYLGGGVANAVISEILQTSGSPGDTNYTPTPLGEMAGHGIAVGRSNRFRKYFEEHGQIIGMMSVLPKTAYSQGVDRSFRKFDKFDFYWPEFAQLGEQEILNHEIYLDPASEGARETTFGYTSRYAEYKYHKSIVAGDFRDDLAYWHMARDFTSLPALNEDFVKSDPTQRIFAIEDETEHKLYAQIYNAISAIRPIPYYNIPKL